MRSAAVDRVGHSGWLVLGEEVRASSLSSPPGGEYPMPLASPVGWTPLRSRCDARIFRRAPV